MDGPEFDKLLTQDLCFQIKQIRKRCGDIVSRESLIHYTDHTIHHMDQVCQNFISLAASCQENNLKLTEYEYFIGLSACYLHDVALQSTIKSKKDVTRLVAYDYIVQRNQHGDAAHNWVQMQTNPTQSKTLLEGPPDLGFGSSEKINKLCALTAPLCKYHCSNPPTNPLKDTKLLSENIRMQLILGLLRLSDALHLDSERVKMEWLKQHEIPVESKVHWWRHHYTDSVSIDNTGLIEIVMSFPTSSSPEESFFMQETYDYINKEVSHFKGLFRKNGIFIDLNPIIIDDTFSNVKLPTPDEIKLLIEARGKIPVDATKVRPEPKATPGRRRSRSYAFSMWGISGHPWVDLPKSYSDDEFVETEDVKHYISWIEDSLTGGQGDIRLVYGDRGIGKTSFLYSVRDFFKDHANTVYIDLSRVFDGLDTATKLYSWLFRKIILELDNAVPTPLDENINETLENLVSSYNGHPIILIDNMDRYLKDPSIKTIKRFFEIAQGALQSLKSKFTILITAHSSWKNFVETEDLSYLGAAPAWTLNSMNPDEVYQLLDKRLKICGSGYDKLFSKDAFRLLHRLGEGNPRLIIGEVLILYEAAVRSHHNIIDEEFINEYFKSDLTNKIHRVLIQTANQFPVVEKLMDACAKFHMRVDQTGIAQDYAWQFVASMFNGNDVAVDNVPDQLRSSFTSLAEISGHGVGGLVFSLKKSIKAALSLLKSSQIGAEEVISLYKIRPISAPNSNSQIEVINRPKVSEENSWILDLAERARERALETLTSPIGAIYNRYWLEYMMILYVKEKTKLELYDYEIHKLGIIMHRGRPVSKFGWRHDKDFGKVLNCLYSDEKHFSTISSMRMVKDTTRPLLDSPSSVLTADQSHLVQLAAKNAVSELISYLLD